VYPIPERNREGIVWQTEDWSPSFWSFSELREANWRTRDKPGDFEAYQGLTEDFLELIDESAGKVRDFVLRWGPLWYCPDHHDCCWRVIRLKRSGRGTCPWHPREPLWYFTEKASELRAAFSIAGLLLSGKLGRNEDWLQLGLSEPPARKLDLQRWILMLLVNERIDRTSRFGIRVAWEKGEDDPRLLIDPAFGFYPLIWLSFGQIITHQQLFICDGCRSLYFRDARIPARGRRNFCQKCRAGDRASKRLSARRRRARKHSKLLPP
jgi:hypothetical protein